MNATLNPNIMSNIIKPIFRSCFCCFLIAISLVTAYGQSGNCPSEDNNLLEKYWATRANFNENFVALPIDEETGELTSDGIGEWDCDEMTFTGQGLGLPFERMDMRTPSNGVRHWAQTGESGGQMQGMYLQMLCTEYDMLGNNGQFAAQKRTLNEIFIALQAFRRLDMTANKLWERHLECSGLNCDWQPDQSGYSGFFIRNDMRDNSQNNFSQVWIANHQVSSNFTDNDQCYGIHNASENQILDCETPCPFKMMVEDNSASNDCANIISQDHVIGMLAGLSFVKTYIPSGQYVTINGVQYEDDVLTIAQKIAHGMVSRIVEADGFVKYPGCDDEFGSNVIKNSGHDARWTIYGMIEAANYITDGNSGLSIPHQDFPFTIDLGIWGIPDVDILVSDLLLFYCGASWVMNDGLSISPEQYENEIEVVVGGPADIPFIGGRFKLHVEFLRLTIPQLQPNQYVQNMYVNLITAGTPGYYLAMFSGINALEVAHDEDNWLMMQHFAVGVNFNLSVISNSDMEWMEDVLCEYACPGGCRKTAAYTGTGDDFPCNNVEGGHWDCGLQWFNETIRTQGCEYVPEGVQYSGIDYMIAYNLYHLAGGTQNTNYFNPFDYEINAENVADIAAGYEGTDDILTVVGGTNLTPCDKTTQVYHFYNGDNLRCPTVTSSENIEVFQVTVGSVKFRVLSTSVEESWIQIVEVADENSPACDDYDDCHLPRKIRIVLEVKDKCDPACATNIGSNIDIYLSLIHI